VWNETKDRRSLLAPDDALVQATGAPTSVASVSAHISSAPVAKHRVLLRPFFSVVHYLQKYSN